MNTVILIPAYKPDEKFVAFSEVLRKNDLTVVAVDDGSGDEYMQFFESVEKLGVTVVHHPVNGGKGKALRTGFAYIKENLPETEGIVTADCDGQHTPEDILRVIKSMEENPDTMIIGGRFAEKQEQDRSEDQEQQGDQDIFHLAHPLTSAAGLRPHRSRPGCRPPAPPAGPPW